jgi:transcription-repair coupling factor (superfamily II helicase)
LGPQQSGHIAAVGFDLYTQLLEEAIGELRAEAGKTRAVAVRPNEPEIKVPFPAFLSEDYIPDVHQRLSLYRRLSAAEDESALDRLESELGDRFGRLPEAAANLFWLIRIKQWLKSMGIDSLSAGRERVSLLAGGTGSRLDPARAIALVASRPQEFQLTPDSKFVAKIPTGGIKELYFGLLALGKSLA